MVRSVEQLSIREGHYRLPRYYYQSYEYADAQAIALKNEKGINPFTEQERIYRYKQVDRKVRSEATTVVIEMEAQCRCR